MTPTTTPMAAWLESAWLARYLDRQLSGDETAWFEAYLLDKPELLAMVEADSELRDALAIELGAGRTSGDFDRGGEAISDADASAEANDSTDSHVPAVSSFRRRPESSTSSRNIAGPTAWLALVASLVLGLGIGWLGQGLLVLRREDESFIANPTRVVFDTVRGAPSTLEIERAESSSPYLLIEVAVPPGAKHIVLHVDKRQVALSQSSDGFVSFLVARASLDTIATAEVRYEQGGQLKMRDIPLTKLDMHGRPK